MDHDVPNTAGNDLMVLIGRFCDDQLSEEESERLHELLTADPRNVDVFVEYMQLHGSLHWEFGPYRLSPILPGTSAESADAPQQARQPDRSTRAFPRRRRHSLVIAGLFAAAVVLAVAVYLVAVPEKLPAPQPPIATITELHRVEWSRGSTPRSLGDQVQATTLNVHRGLVQLALDSGHVLLLEAPAELDLLTSGHVRLQRGRLYCNINSEAPFVVETPGSWIRDVGTKFGVEAGAGFEVIQVYEGRVAVESKRDEDSVELAGMEALRIGKDDDPVEAPFSAHRFIRQMPKADESAADPVFPAFGQESTSQIDVSQAEWPVRVDGQLDEWPADPGFTRAALPPLQGQFGVRGWMRYDATNLYVAAHVDDPNAMNGRIDPHVMPQLASTGGSVQVRIAPDRPDAAAAWDDPGDEETDSQLVHVTMWYFADTQTSCLSIQYGADGADCVVNPLGFDGVFRRLEGGSGYVVEYSIPWSLLRCAGDPPQSGDMLPVSWRITWSDGTGRNLLGQLDDLGDFAADASGSTATWGKAVFLQ